jgi:peptide/nickel transport system permease protein
MQRVCKKAIRYLLAVGVIVTLTFLIPRLVPGDPVVNLLGEDVSLGEGQAEKLREELGLDAPLGRQYGEYCKSLFRLDLGYSHHYHEKVFSLIRGRMKWTLLFVAPSVILGALFGALLGANAGWNAGRLSSKTETAVFLLVYSIPPFFLALLFLYFFAFELGLFPLKGYYRTGALSDVLHHLALPVLVLTLFTLARNYMIIRGSVLQEKRRLYVIYARAKGLSRRSVLRRHVFWNASLPLISLVALDFGFIFSGALLIEIVFSMNGMGTLIYDAVEALDYPVLQGSFLLIALMIVIANMAADFLYALIDPRVRVQR